MFSVHHTRSHHHRRHHSLHHRLSRVPDEAVLYPGHLYSPQPSAPMGETRRDNFVFKPRSEEQWLAMFGR